MYTIDNLPCSIQLNIEDKCACGKTIHRNKSYDFHMSIEDSYNITYYRARKYKMWYKWDDFHAIENTFEECINEMVKYLESIGEKIL